MHMKNVFSFSLLIAVMSMILCGCASTTTEAVYNDDAVLYYSDDAVDPLNYVTYTNKEINLVMNELSIHIANADSLSKEEYVISDEIAAVNESLNLVQEAIDRVEHINPPSDYEDDRETILRRMTNAEDSLTLYLSALQENETENLSTYIDLMHGDYVSLSGSFNIMWE